MRHILVVLFLDNLQVLNRNKDTSFITDTQTFYDLQYLSFKCCFLEMITITMKAFKNIGICTLS